jgi:hypothetical protein
MKVIIFLLIFSLLDLSSEAAPGPAKEDEDSVRGDSGFFGHLTKGNKIPHKLAYKSIRVSVEFKK